MLECGQFKKLQTFDLSKMILHMLVFQEDIQPIKDKDLFSILIYPRNDKASELIRNDRQSMDFHTYLHLAKDENFFFLFSIFFRYKHFYNAQGVSLSYLEIQGINKMKKRSERIELINAMRHEFEFIFKQEDKNYKNPILIEQLCYSLFSSQIQLNQTQSSIENNFNSMTQRSFGGHNSSSSSRKHSDFEQQFLNIEDSIEEKRQGQKFFDTDTNGTYDSSINKYQIALSPPNHLSSFQARNSLPKMIPIDLNWNNPLSIKQQQFTLNDIQGDIVSVAGQSFADTPGRANKDISMDSGMNSILNSMNTGNHRVDSSFSQQLGIKYVNSIKGTTLKPQLDDAMDGQIVKHLRRKSSEFFYMNQEKIGGKEQLTNIPNLIDTKQGMNFSIKALTKQYGKEFAPPSQYSLLKRSSMKDNEIDLSQNQISARKRYSQNESNKQQRVSFEDEELNLKCTTTQRSANNQYNFSYQPETSPRRHSEDDTGDYQLNSVQNIIRVQYIYLHYFNQQKRQQNEESCWDWSLLKFKQFLEITVIFFTFFNYFKQIIYEKQQQREIVEKNNKIAYDPSYQYTINVLTESNFQDKFFNFTNNLLQYEGPKSHFQDESKRNEGNKSEQLSSFHKHSLLAKENIQEPSQRFFNTLQGESINPIKQNEVRSQSLSDLTQKIKSINSAQKELFIEKVEEEKENEGETQQKIESNDNIPKLNPFNKLKSRVNKIIQERYQDKDTNSIHTPQIYLNNTYDLSDFKTQKKNLRQERIQELKRIMINASQQYTSISQQRNLNQIKKRLDKQRNSQSFQEDDDDQQRDKEVAVDNQSIQSSQSDHLIKKTIFLDMIESKKSPQVIRTIDYFGKISIICMVIVALLSYGILKYQYESEVYLYQEQSNCDNLLSRVVNLMTYYNYGKICTERSDWSLIQDDDCTDSNQFDIGFQQRLDLVKDVLSTMLRSTKNENFQDFYFSKELEMRTESNADDDEYQTSLADLNHNKFAYVFNSLQQYFYNLKRGGEQQKPKGYDRFFYLNMEYFLFLLKQLSDDSFIEVKDVLIDIKNTQRMTLIILILTIFIIISMAVPMFIRVQYSRQEILQLFGTYSFGKLVDTQRQILETIIEILPLYYDFTRNTVVYVKKNAFSEQNNSSLGYSSLREKKMQEINNFRLYLEKLLIACEPIMVQQQFISNHKENTEKYENIIYGDKENNQSFTDAQQTDYNYMQTETQQLKQFNTSIVLANNPSNMILNKNLYAPKVNLVNTSFNNIQQQQLSDLELTPNLNKQSSSLIAPIVLVVPPPTSSNKLQAQQISNQLTVQAETTGRQFNQSQTRQSIQQTDFDLLGKTIVPSRINQEGYRVSQESTTHRYRQMMTPDMRSSSETTRKRVAIIQQQKKQNFLYNQIITHLNFKKDYLPYQEEGNDSKQAEQYFSNSTDNIKKRNISQTSLLSKLNMELIIKVTLIFSIISAFPAMNYLVSENFINQMNRNVDILQILALSKFSVLNQVFFQTSKWVFLLKGENKDLINDYSNQINELFSLNQQSILKLYNAQEIMKDSKERDYQEVDYSSIDILFYTIQKNACPILGYVYLSRNETESIPQCQVLFMNGVFQKGLIVGLQQMITSFTTFIQGDATVNTELETSDLLFKYDQNFNLKELLEVTEISNKIYQQLRDFLIYYTKHFYSEQTELQNILILTYAMITLVIGLTLFWMRFIRKTSQSLIETKNLLGILSLQLLVENRYIYSFLNRQAKNKS